VDYGIAASEITWESRLLVTQRRWHAQNLISEFNISPSDTRLIIPILRRWKCGTASCIAVLSNILN